VTNLNEGVIIFHFKCLNKIFLKWLQFSGEHTAKKFNQSPSHNYQQNCISPYNFSDILMQTSAIIRENFTWERKLVVVNFIVCMCVSMETDIQVIIKIWKIIL
jgi:hypothetical protein